MESHAKLQVKKQKALGQDDRRIQAELCKKTPLARERENTLRRNPSKAK